MSENELPDGFDGYVEISNDPGPIVLIVTVVLCAVMLGILPFLVGTHSKLHNRKIQDSSIQRNSRKDVHNDGAPTRPGVSTNKRKWPIIQHIISQLSL